MAVITTKTTGAAEGGQVDLADAGGHFSTDTAEAALQQLGAAELKQLTLDIGMAELTDAAVSQTLNFTVPAGSHIIEGVAVELDTEFSGGGAGSVTVEIGQTGDTDGFMAAQDVFTGAGAGMHAGAAGVLLGGMMDGANLTATVTSDVNVADLTAGDMHLHVMFRTVVAAD